MKTEMILDAIGAIDDYVIQNAKASHSSILRISGSRKIWKSILIAAVITALLLSTVAAAAYIYKVLITNRNTELPSYEVTAEIQQQEISSVALNDLKIKPYQTYKENYTEIAEYFGLNLLISQKLEGSILGDGVDIQGSYFAGEKPITSVTLYSSHDTGSDLSGYIDMSIYISIGTKETYAEITQILNPELSEKDAVLSEYVSEKNGITAQIAVYDALGRASTYFVNNGILYNISVGGFVDEDIIDPAVYLKELIDTFE